MNLPYEPQGETPLTDVEEIMWGDLERQLLSHDPGDLNSSVLDDRYTEFDVQCTLMEEDYLIGHDVPEREDLPKKKMRVAKKMAATLTLVSMVLGVVVPMFGERESKSTTKATATAPTNTENSQSADDERLLEKSYENLGQQILETYHPSWFIG